MGLEQTTPQALKEDLDSALGCAIDIVASSATAARHGSNDCKAAVALGLQLIGEQCQERYGRGEIKMQRFNRLVDLLLALILIRKRPVGNECYVDPAEGGNS